MKKIILIVLIVIIAALLLVKFGYPHWLAYKEWNIVNVDTCMKAGYPSVPTVGDVEECRTPGGKKFEWHNQPLEVRRYDTDVGGIITDITPQKITIYNPWGNAVTILLNDKVIYYDKGGACGRGMKEISFSSFHIGDWVASRGWTYSYGTKPTEVLFAGFVAQNYPPGEGPTCNE